MKTATLIFLGCVCVVLGAVGLIIPVIPGILFLLIAALCFATISPRLHRSMQRHPRTRRLLNHMNRSRGLALPTRARLMCWALLEAVFPNQRGSRNL